MRVITEPEFKKQVDFTLRWMLYSKYYEFWAVTGPGRSGAVASVYASHLLRIPFIPFGVQLPKNHGRVLIVDTAKNSGRTLRRAERKYEDHRPLSVWFYNEPPRVRFWYEEWEE